MVSDCKGNDQTGPGTKGLGLVSCWSRLYSA